MTNVAVMGAGQMGAALAGAFLANGHQVAVWNRTPARCEPLRAKGAAVAGSPADAARACEMMVVCIRDYASTRKLLRPAGVAAALKGKLLVQLSSGTPAEARGLESWCQQRGMAYLDGAILGYPRGIGAGRATVLYSGPRELFDQARPTLLSLSPNPVFIARSIGAAATLDAALLSTMYTSYIGFLHGAAICDSEGLPISALIASLGEGAALVGFMKEASRMIETGDYSAEGMATIETHGAGQAHFVGLSRANGIASDIPRLASRYFKRAIAAGYGQDEMGRLFELVRRP
jgi:3-hydroxyisobutyrate dehydrogenase-like beta-hydroxyacid dehydrogenase